jgi:DNA-binding helix-hairpin-helix protein with protein kinase domain
MVVLATAPQRKIQLSERPVGEGGQATVFGVEADPELVVKLYREPSDELERRLESMLLLAQPDDFLSEDVTRQPVLTWPSALVKSSESGRVIGYAMRRVGGPEFVPLGTLFNPAQRHDSFPDVSWRFLLGVARNLAALLDALHERDLVLGDVSHANIVLGQSGYLTFLDCDSMLFTDPRSGERFPCEYFTAEYAAPELQHDELTERSPATDDFSLAVLVCRLLLVGDHPFMGIRLAGDEEPDVGRNIRDGYSYLVRPRDIGLPPGSFGRAVLPPTVRELAERAFGPGHLDPEARPTSAEWLAALDQARSATTACAESPLHAFGAHLDACPWCARVDAGFPDAFRAVPVAVPPVTGGRRRRVLSWAITFVVALAILVVLLLLTSQ